MTPPNYNDQPTRNQQWSALGKEPAFTDFFLGDYLKKREDEVNRAILETCPPEKLEEKRALARLLREIREYSHAAILTASKSTP